MKLSCKQCKSIECALCTVHGNGLWRCEFDGNMTSDGRFRYTWNAENRLVLAQELCAPSNRFPYTVSYAYDHRGRMVSKRITENDGQDTLVKSISYLWDGWNIIREIQWPEASGQWPVVTDNVWGLDLDGTLQGAGGVGGLLAVVRDGETYLPTYDANGNVSEYVSTDGSIVAHYDYSPFGETLIESGDLASSFTHRFSTKPWCPVTGLYEYQMRKYRPEIGRWLSRDPIGEDASDNLLLFCSNKPLTHIDIIGKDNWGPPPPWGGGNQNAPVIPPGMHYEKPGKDPRPWSSWYALQYFFNGEGGNFSLADVGHYEVVTKNVLKQLKNGKW